MKKDSSSESYAYNQLLQIITLANVVYVIGNIIIVFE
jgi:hypothetical protein